MTMEPWFWRNDWLSRWLVYSSHPMSLGWIVLALLVAMLWPPLLVPVLGLLLLYGAVRLATIGLHHPRLVLVLDHLPQYPGDGFTGRVHAASLPEGEIRASLACICWPHSRDEQTWWSDEHVIARRRGEIPIDFCAPFGTREIPEGEDVVWRLSIEAGELKGTFEVPVFPSPMPSPP